MPRESEQAEAMAELESQHRDVTNNGLATRLTPHVHYCAEHEHVKHDQKGKVIGRYKHSHSTDHYTAGLCNGMMDKQDKSIEHSHSEEEVDKPNDFKIPTIMSEKERQG